MAKNEDNLGEILNKIIDDTIKGILGEGAAEIYFHMKEHGIKSDNLGEKPEVLERAMSEIFKAGWNVFKKAILRSLCEELNISKDKFVDHDFVECIEIARQEFLLMHASSTGQNQITNKVEIQGSKLKAHHNSILKLSLPEVGPRIAHKSCKLCGTTINTRNKEGFLAELCDECWELQNDVWKVAEVAHVPGGSEHKEGDDKI